ncbi:hypothetical protein KC330_g198 [Hortaea werneckii]|nr:hypothetical protein KC330_g198 [Hortaea werneckii]
MGSNARVVQTLDGLAFSQNSVCATNAPSPNIVPSPSQLTTESKERGILIGSCVIMHNHVPSVMPFERISS